jgi:uncharacterized protein affecting Mg2+/Co2+ transport
LKQGDKIEGTSAEGVIGEYPILSHLDQPKFVFESCQPVEQLNAQMMGYFDFKYINGVGDQMNSMFRAYVDPFVLGLKAGEELVDTPFFEEWMNM